jgi:uncharacterized membrane protein (UPF0127 family)
MRTAKAISYGALICVLFASLYMYGRGTTPLATTPEGDFLTGGTTTISIERALSQEAKQKGLSGRASLAEDSGLLFVFDRPDVYPFWMPDMHFAIDIIWIDGEKRIVTIKENATPESYPTLFRADSPALYVLEVNSGDARKWGWAPGTVLSFK